MEVKMTRKSLEDMTGSDLAEQTLAPLLKQVKDSKSPILFCSLTEKVKSVKTGETGLFLREDNIVRGLEELPSDAEMYFRVADADQNILGCYRIGGVERELDGDNNFLGYRPHVKACVRQQAGIVLRYLLTFEREFYFKNEIERKGFVEVNEDLIEELLIAGIEPKLEILHL